jgi:hypothetical protein
MENEPEVTVVSAAIIPAVGMLLGAFLSRQYVAPAPPASVRPARLPARSLESEDSSGNRELEPYLPLGPAARPAGRRAWTSGTWAGGFLLAAITLASIHVVALKLGEGSGRREDTAAQVALWGTVSILAPFGVGGVVWGVTGSSGSRSAYPAIVLGTALGIIGTWGLSALEPSGPMQTAIWAVLPATAAVLAAYWSRPAVWDAAPADGEYPEQEEDEDPESYEDEEEVEEARLPLREVAGRWRQPSPLRTPVFPILAISF